MIHTLRSIRLVVWLLVAGWIGFIIYANCIGIMEFYDPAGPYRGGTENLDNWPGFDGLAIADLIDASRAVIPAIVFDYLWRRFVIRRWARPAAHHPARV